MIPEPAEIVFKSCIRKAEIPIFGFYLYPLEQDPANRPLAEQASSSQNPEPAIPESKEPVDPEPAGLATEPDSQSENSASIPQDDQTMEVHHHGHVHHEKKWKEYLFQFFMLFLAVFCGFLAEYKLEQTIEHHREEEYMAALLQDLRSDTAAFRLAVNRFHNNTKTIDSVFVLLNSSERSNTSEIYFQGREVIGSYYRLWYNSRTFEQMKYSGNLRLIRQKGVADSITNYYQSLKYLDESRELLNQRHAAVSDYSSLIFDSYVFQKMVQPKPFKIIRYPGNPPLMPYTPQELNKYEQSLTLMYGLETIQADNLERKLIPLAERLIRLIEEKYY